MDKQIKNVVIDFNSFSEKFLEDGYIVKSALNDNNLYRIRKKIVEITCDILKINYPQNEEIFLKFFHKFIDNDKINDLRLLIYNSLNSLPWFKALYYSIGENFVKSLVGNELVIQKRVNLSIQLPKDDSSLLPVHADVWNGDSPFELVMWLPMVDCYKSKSMFSDFLLGYMGKSLPSEIIDESFSSIYIYNPSTGKYMITKSRVPS